MDEINQNKKPRLLLADDHIIMLDCLTTKLEKQSNFHVIARAKNGREAVRLAMEMLPDIVVMDINMPELNGIEATAQIIKAAPQIKVLGLSMHSDKKYIIQMFKAGASGYILKDCSFKELAFAIDVLMKDQFYLTPQITGFIVKDILNSKPSQEDEPVDVLSQKEKEVLQLIAEGKSSKEIAEELFINVRTVETHRLNIKKKLEIHTTAGLVKYAIKTNLTFL